MMEEIRVALAQIDEKIARKEQEIERCEKRLKDAKADLIRARDRRNTIIGTYITSLGGGDAKSLDAFLHSRRKLFPHKRKLRRGRMKMRPMNLLHRIPVAAAKYRRM